MPRPRAVMRKIREVLRLIVAEGLSRRQVGASVGLPYKASGMPLARTTWRRTSKYPRASSCSRKIAPGTVPVASSMAWSSRISHADLRDESYELCGVS